MTNKYKTQAAELVKLGVSKLLEADKDFDSEKILSSIEVPPDPKLGDFSSTICFDLSKMLKKPPALIAKKLASKIGIKGSSFERVETAGPGYVNFFLEFEGFAKDTVSAAIGKKIKPKPAKKTKKITVEFPSVNPGKPLHIGHARNAVLGMIVSNALEFVGNLVVRMDYPDDLGLQVAQTVWGYQNLCGTPDPSMKLDYWQGIQYVEVAKKIDDPKVSKEVNGIMKKMEEGGNETATFAEKIALESVDAQKITTQRMNVFSDVMVRESDLVKNGVVERAIEHLKKGKSLVKEEQGPNKGCFVVKLGHLDEFRGMENPDKIIVRSNGATTYTGKDIGFHLWKFGLSDTKLKYKKHLVQKNGAVLWCVVSKDSGVQEHEHESRGEEKPEFNSVDAAINVIGSEQKYPQKVVKKSLEAMGFVKEAENLHHLSYEFVVLPDAKISGRKGTWVGAGVSTDEVLDESVERVKTLINGRAKTDPSLSMNKKELADVSEKVGVGAVIFALAKVSPDKKIIFKWDEVLSFEGESGPYLQYACVRASKILSKAKEKQIDTSNLSKFDASVLSSEVEKALVRKLWGFCEAVDKTALELKPNILTEYTTELASAFSSFYNLKQVLNAEKQEERQARLALVLATKNTLEAALKLLGIEVPEKM
ncbi:MAG: arginine--tRNA ligase [Candidatus Diapherotrites archaeon]|nr:arginine--tRNA ligase [Candidatus Diapherotrites archaeon]